MMALVQALTDGGRTSPSGEESPRRPDGTTAPREKLGGCGGTAVVVETVGVPLSRPLPQPPGDHPGNSRSATWPAGGHVASGPTVGPWLAAPRISTIKGRESYSPSQGVVYTQNLVK